MQDFEKILTKFDKIVSPNFCNDLARKYRLIQRSTNRLQGHEFAQAMMVPHAFLEAETLNSLAGRMQRINKTCSLSASALSQKINTKSAVAFMRACFEKVLIEVTKQCNTECLDLKNISTRFNHVYVEDSTQCELHQKLSPSFNGSGGTASKASLKINFIIDYLSESVADLYHCPGNIPDQALAGRAISILEKNDIIIRDLGYFVLEWFSKIEEKGSYYISRWKSNLNIYVNQEDIKPIEDLAKFLDKHMDKGLIDIEIFVSNKKHPMRLIACLMNENIINKRNRDANRSAQCRGVQLGKKKKSLLKYAIFITNAPNTLLSSTEVMSLYRARWRIELVFKSWKSCLKLHIFKGYNKERFYCLLYGRLIMILLLGALCPILMQTALQMNQELSTYKFFNYIVADHVFARAIQEGKLKEFTTQLFIDLPRRLCMDKRKRLSLRGNIRIAKSYYKEQKTNELCKIAA